ncbi:MAG: hypothetical protein EXR95_09790 [Gemmatimonadetes bacterium]|nr:hypothetical protein [Gemmatimonadota bacterium]
MLPVPAAWTEMGFSLVGEHHVGEKALLSWQAYLVNGVTLDFALEEKISTRAPKRDRLLVESEVGPTQGAFDGSNTADALTGRLSFSPALGSELAVSGYTGPYTPDFLDVGGRPTTPGPRRPHAPRAAGGGGRAALHDLRQSGRRGHRLRARRGRPQQRDVLRGDGRELSPEDVVIVGDRARIELELLPQR